MTSVLHGALVDRTFLHLDDVRQEYRQSDPMGSRKRTN